MCDHCGCRTFPAIAALSVEHDTILELAWQLAEAAPGSAVATAARAELCSLLTSHVAVEEDALYPLLAATGDLTCETYDSLEEEHRALHDALEEQRFDRRAFYALAAHIEQEEMELFPAAMFAFDDDQWATLETTQRSVLLATS